MRRMRGVVRACDCTLGCRPAGIHGAKRDAVVCVNAVPENDASVSVHIQDQGEDQDKVVR